MKFRYYIFAKADDQQADDCIQGTDNERVACEWAREVPVLDSATGKRISFSGDNAIIVEQTTYQL